jgi:hypothetical protein
LSHANKKNIQNTSIKTKIAQMEYIKHLVIIIRGCMQKFRVRGGREGAAPTPGRAHPEGKKNIRKKKRHAGGTHAGQRGM